MSEQRPGWMPTGKEFIDAVNSDSYLPGPGFPKTERLVRKTGLRAQIAVLEWAQGQLHMGLAINAEIERLRKELEG